MFDTQNRAALKPLPTSDYHNCFGCSPKNEAGLHMTFFTSQAMNGVVSWLNVPDHLCGWANLVHGGIVATIMDEAMGWAALLILKKVILSKSIAVDYLKPVLAGEEIRVEADIRQINSEREAVAQGWIYNKQNALCTRSSSVIALFSLETIKKMGVVEDRELDELKRVMNGGQIKTITA